MRQSSQQVSWGSEHVLGWATAKGHFSYRRCQVLVAIDFNFGLSGSEIGAGL
jgi:hypothetical protein